MHIPVDWHLIVNAPSGTNEVAYPKSKLDVDTPVTKGVVYPSASLYKLNGPVADPANVNVIIIFIIY